MLSLLIHSVFRACADMRDPDYTEREYEAISKQMRQNNEPMSELSDPIDD
jgi:hypothetical protein